jgi:hypothetical protein
MSKLRVNCDNLNDLYTLIEDSKGKNIDYYTVIIKDYCYGGLNLDYDAELEDEMLRHFKLAGINVKMVCSFFGCPSEDDRFKLRFDFEVMEVSDEQL